MLEESEEYLSDSSFEEPSSSEYFSYESESEASASDDEMDIKDDWPAERYAQKSTRNVSTRLLNTSLDLDENSILDMPNLPCDVEAMKKTLEIFKTGGWMALGKTNWGREQYANTITIIQTEGFAPTVTNRDLTILNNRIFVSDALSNPNSKIQFVNNNTKNKKCGWCGALNSAEYTVTDGGLINMFLGPCCLKVVHELWAFFKLLNDLVYEIEKYPNDQTLILDSHSALTQTIYYVLCAHKSKNRW